MFIKFTGGILAMALIVGYIYCLLRRFERGNVYFPSRAMAYTPSETGLEFEDVYITTRDNVRLNGWFIPSGAADGKTVLLFHGNAGNISYRLDIIRMLNELGLNVFIPDYRGYGKSGGTASEQGTYLDAEAAYEYLLSRGDVDEQKIILYGKSLGGAVAVDLAAKGKGAMLILDSTFTSVGDVAREIYPFLPSWALSIKYDNIAKISKVTVPKLIMHSKEDEVIRFYHGRKLFQKASGPKEFFQSKGRHNTGIIDHEYDFKERIGAFLEKHSVLTD
ncbi:MAG: alpha/beta hydrolase [Candidatus Omnitrophota bacterium]